MKVNLNVDVHHLTRVEGHGNIRVRVKNGEVREARWDVVETPRYFEAMLRGKHYATSGILTARICGICSIGHCLASLRATESLTLGSSSRFSTAWIRSASRRSPSGSRCPIPRGPRHGAKPKELG